MMGRPAHGMSCVSRILLGKGGNRAMPELVCGRVRGRKRHTDSERPINRSVRYLVWCL